MSDSISLRFRTALFITFLSLFTINLHAQDSTSVDTLVAYYPFNGDASDSSGFGNDGVVYGASLTEDRFGRTDSAYSFDGIDDYIDIGKDSSFNFSTEFTFSVWAKGVSSETSITGLIASGRGYPYMLGIDDGDRLFMRVANSGNPTNLFVEGVTTNINSWHHYVGVYKASEYLKVYKDGVEVGSLTESIPANIDLPDSNLWIGARQNSFNPELGYFFEGDIDDIKIYSYALNSLEVKESFVDEGGVIPLIPDTLVAHYPFSGNAMDSSGFGNDGEVFGANLTEDRFGNPNSAYTFDGNFDYIEIQDDPLFTSPTKTVEFWFNKTDDPSKTTGDGLIWKSFTTSAVRDYSFMLTREEEAFGMYNAVSNGSDASVYTWMDSLIYPDMWYHVVGVIDTSSNSLYVNGQHIVTVEHDGEVINHGAPISIGRASSSSLASRYFIGEMDDIKIYNYALSDSAIQESYSYGGWPLPPPPIDSTGTVIDTLIAHYSFDGNVADLSGFGNDGEVFGAELTVDRFGRTDSAYFFDGSDYIDFGSSDTVEFGTEDFSLSVWVKPQYLGKSQYQILRKGSDFATDGEARWSLALDEDGKIRIIFEDADQGDSTLVLYGERPLLDEEWHHIAVVFDRDSTLRVFVDNEEEISSDRIKDYSGYITNQEDFQMFAGRGNSGASQFSFVGSMDDIRVYSYALDDSALVNLYTEGVWPLPIVELPDTLVAHYPFNGNAMDSSGFGNDGEVFGANLTEDRFGNPNSAYTFDGDFDYIEIQDDPVFTSPTKTVEFWFNKTDDPEKTTGGGLIWKSFTTSAIRDYSFMITREDTTFGMYNAVSNGSDTSVYTWMDSPIYPDRWYHVVGVIDTSSNSLYVDGQHIVTVEHDGEVINHGAPISIGRASSSSLANRYFVGDMDDIKIYNYALSDSAIKDSYVKGGGTLPEAELPDTLVAYYPFNGDASDSSGFGNDGEVFGASLTEDRFGRVDSAYSFDGINDYIEIPDTSILNSNVRTIEFWFKKTSPVIEEGLGNTYVEGILWKSFDASVNRDYSFSVTNQESLFDFYNTIGNGGVELFQARIEEVIESNKWYHIVGVIDTSKTVTYINGVQKIVLENDGSVVHTGAPITIGRASTSSRPERYFNGVIDDIKIYNYELDSVSVWNSYTEGGWPIPEAVISDTLVAYYPFNGNASDSSGFGNDGEVFGASLTEDRFGRVDSAYSFDGIDDYISTNTSFDYPERSFSLWIKANTVDTVAGAKSFILQQNSYDLNYSPFEVFFFEGSLNFREGFSSVQTEKNFIEEEKWYHLATARNDSVLKGYINGVLVDSIFVEDQISETGDTNTLIIGSEYANTSFFDGTIDELTIYNYAITDSAVWDIFTEAGFPPDSLGNSTESNIYIPEEFALYQNYPNPFNPSTTIKFDLAETGLVSLKVFDITGRLVATLINGTKSAGRYQINFNASNFSSGVYLYELRTNQYSSIKKFTLIK